MGGTVQICGNILAYQNSIDEEIKSKLKSWNIAYHLVQNLLSSSFLSNNVKIKIYRSIIVNGVLFGRKTWSLSWRKECTLWRSRVRRCGGYLHLRSLR